MVGSFRWLVVLTTALAVVFVTSGWSEAGLDRARLPGELLLVAANTLPLLAVRWNPLAVVLTFGVTYPVWVELDFPTHELQSLPSLVALYALGAWDRPLRVRALGLLLPVWMVGAAVAGLWDIDWLGLTYVGVVFVVVWVIGAVVADRRAYARELEERTAELEAARQELAVRAVADERARIARELHDVVAHAMSVITVQAGVGGHLVERSPGQAATSLAVIERTGREALAEMRRMLTVLRDPSDTDPASPAPLQDPQPGLDAVPDLVARAADAGSRLRYTTRGTPRPLPAGLELAAYRVVQEAVTNVVKHAPGARGAVTVTYGPGELEVEVTNAAARPPAAIGAGYGLRGMQERVALYGGRLDTGHEDGRFRVLASFPIEPPA